MHGTKLQSASNSDFHPTISATALSPLLKTHSLAIKAGEWDMIIYKREVEYPYTSIPKDREIYPCC